MILLKWIKNNVNIFKEKMLLRKISIETINNFFNIYDQWITIESQLNLLRQQRNNNISKEANDYSKELKKNIQTTENLFNQLNDQLNDLLMSFPNILDDSVPEGKNHEENQVVNQWIHGQKPTDNHLHYEYLDNDLLEQVTHMSQSRFIGLKGAYARLHRAIGNFCLDFLKEEGFVEYLLPSVLNYDGFKKSGHVPFFEDDLFWLEDKKLGLIPTSEVSIGNILLNKTLDYEDLPLKICCFSPCFRKEAGAAGKDTRGLIRLHQFFKVEMFMVTDEENSNKYHDYMANLVEKILQKLNLSYRKILLCSGDTGNHSAKTYDLEVWLPLQNRWLEISSCSNIKNFQSSRLKNKYKHHNNKIYTHTLNGSCLPIERTVATILENYQTPAGIVIPTVLRPYLNNEDLIK